MAHDLSWANATIEMLITSYVCHGLKFKGCRAYIPSHLERMSTPFGRSLFDFYRGNFHERKNKKWVPSLPTIGGVCNDDAVYVLKSQQDEILAALRLTRSKHDGEVNWIPVSYPTLALAGLTETNHFPFFTSTV